MAHEPLQNTDLMKAKQLNLVAQDDSALIYLHQAVQEISVKYEIAEKELQILRQQSKINRQNTILYISAVSLLVAGILVVLLFYIMRIYKRGNRELAETNAIKDKFFSIISHDLKNPAIFQRDAIQILLENTGRWDIETLRKYYQDLLYSADHQVDLLYNLLNWAHVQTGRMPFTPRLFDLTACLRTDLALLQYMADFKNIRLNINLPEHALVTGDSDMQTTVVRNLVTNAIKFTNSGGEVTLAVSPCEPCKDAISTTFNPVPEQAESKESGWAWLFAGNFSKNTAAGFVWKAKKEKEAGFGLMYNIFGLK